MEKEGLVEQRGHNYGLNRPIDPHHEVFGLEFIFSLTMFVALPSLVVLISLIHPP